MEAVKIASAPTTKKNPSLCSRYINRLQVSVSRWGFGKDKPLNRFLGVPKRQKHLHHTF